jgi:hypothetical protein
MYVYLRIPLSGVGTTCFHHVTKIRQLFLRPAACLMSTLETGVGANNCKCSRDQQLNVPFESRSNNWLSIRSHADRTDRLTIELSYMFLLLSVLDQPYN